jgi:hypothetical protein
MTVKVDERFIVYRSRDLVPKFDIALPRPLRALHQLELSSRCNLKCVYCPSHKLGRPKVDMSWETFLRALEWVEHFVARGTQHELNLAGIGESTLNPEFPAMVAEVRRRFGSDFRIVLATNGVATTEEMVEKIAPFGPAVWVSLHRPEKAAPAVGLYRKYGLLEGVSTDPATNGNSWAGQVDWPDTPGYVSPCMWLRYGLAMALADGRITTCCIDASGAGAVARVTASPVGVADLAPYTLCASCHQEIAIRGYEQRVTP